IHLVLSDRSRGLVGAKELGLMKKSAYLINTSRGPIVDEKALIAVLNSKSIAGAGLDVFDIAPLPLDHPFRKMDNVVITPHLGYVSEQNYRKYFPDIVEDIRAWLDGKPVRVIESKLHAPSSPRKRGRIRRVPSEKLRSMGPGPPSLALGRPG